MAGSPMSRQLAPGGFMLRSGRPRCGPISLLAQESGRPQRRPESALLFSGWPQDLFGLVLFRKGTHVQKGVKNESFDPDDKAARIRVPQRKDLHSNINFFRKGAERSVVQFASAGEIEDFFVLRVGRLALDAKQHCIFVRPCVAQRFTPNAAWVSWKRVGWELGEVLKRTDFYLRGARS